MTLDEFLKKYPDSTMRAAATKKLRNQSLLNEIAREDSNPLVREAAVDKLMDQYVLTEIAWTDEYQHVQSAARSKLKCMVCGKKLDFERKIRPGLHVAQHLIEIIGRTAYVCQSCGSLICMDCAKRTHCVKCGSRKFDIAIDVPRSDMIKRLLRQS